VDNKRLSLGKLFSFAWNTWKSRFPFFLGFFLVVFLVPALLFFLWIGAIGLKLEVFGFIVFISQGFFLMILYMGAIKVCLKCVDKELLSFRELYRSTPLFFKFFFGYVLYNLLVFVGLMFFVIPGIYWATKYCLIPYFIIDKKVGPLEAMVLSGKATEGVKLKLLGLIIVFKLINLLGILAFFVGLFFTIPLSILCFTAAYRKLESKMVEG